ncbi:hypothetical protein F2Q69_00005621 [Brassica cretica]|uniref:Uncharacterized protein n=1 Tax=Brassica cretica TaxID=69181 RepID=A0A8S9PIM4_BRACR|nr:hypothetical protein F2Q69_00005621 [Brassica cretica]
MRKNHRRRSSGDGTKTKRGFGGGTTRKRSSSAAARTQFGHLKHCRRLACRTSNGRRRSSISSQCHTVIDEAPSLFTLSIFFVFRVIRTLPTPSSAKLCEPKFTPSISVIGGKSRNSNFPKGHGFSVRANDE